MTENNSYLAIDLGAESGRVIHGALEDGKLHLDEVHRFANRPVCLPDGLGKSSLRWDVLYLWREVLEGIAHYVRGGKSVLSGIGIDAWGVDFCLLDPRGEILGNPYHYRDSRTDGMVEKVLATLPPQAIYEQTGIQFMQINTLIQLYAMAQANAPELELAETLLTIPDLFNFWLTGRKLSEFSIATTTQCYNPSRKDWAWELLDSLKIPRRIFPGIVRPGTILGPLQPVTAREVGLDPSHPIQVIAPACHDTGSAAAAVPAESDNFVWISSGTWSVMGVNAPEPVINERSLWFNFTNEGGVGGGYRLSKNVMGLWLVQECRHTWASAGEEHSYADLMKMAQTAKPLIAVIDPDDPSFLQPGDMPIRISQYCKRTDQPALKGKGSIIRGALEGIALKYRWVLERLEEMTERKFDTLHIVGGGSQNRLLNQFAADCTGRRVIAGPVEATAAGNILIQAYGLGKIARFADCAGIVRDSFDVEVYEPGDQAPWDAAYQKLLKLMH